MKSGKATLLLDEERPGVDELPEVATESVTVESKDGLRLPVLVHRPVANKGKLPVIVFFHGGPSAVATAHWNRMVRFFTSLGYAFVEPNIRGSTGFGRAYEAADDYLNRPEVFNDQRAVATWVSILPVRDVEPNAAKCGWCASGVSRRMSGIGKLVYGPFNSGTDVFATNQPPSDRRRSVP